MTQQQKQYTTGEGGLLSSYKSLVVGEASTLSWISYELITTLFGNCPGILGFGTRSLLYKHLFKQVGEKIAFGKGITLRVPDNICLGSNLLFDDFVTLDARGAGSRLELDNFVSVGRFTTIAAKGGRVKLSPGVNVGSYCRIATQTSIEIGESVLIAAYSYVGPGNHSIGDGEVPLIERDMDLKGGVKIGSHSWIGTRSTILDGVSIGTGAIVGAHTLVREDVPDYGIVVGTPGKIIGYTR